MEEYRKLIKFGSSSHVISLPISWIKKNKLKKGDIINFYENKNNELIVSLNSKNIGENLGSINIDTNNKDIKLVEREIIAAYLNGYYTISVIGNVRENIKVIRHFFDRLMGFEIVEQNKTSIISKDFMDMNKFSVETSLRKMDISVKMIFSEFKNFNSDKSFKNIQIYDRDICRYMFLFRRMYKIALGSRTKESFGYTLDHLLRWWEVAHHIERIGARLKTTYHNLKMIENERTAKEILKLINKIENYYFECMKCYYSKNLDDAYKISDIKRKEMIPRFDKLKNLKPNNLYLGLVLSDLKFIISSIHMIIRRVYS